MRFAEFRGRRAAAVGSFDSNLGGKIVDTANAATLKQELLLV